MDPVSLEKFDEITKLDADELAMDENEAKLEFLKARRTYLRPEQKAVYKELLAKDKNLKPLSDKDQEAFDKADGLARAKAEKEADKLKKQTKTVKESQNPNND